MGRIVLKSEPKSLIFNHLFSTHLNDVPLLSNTHVFEVLKTNSHLSIQMRRKLACCLHVNATLATVQHRDEALCRSGRDRPESPHIQGHGVGPSPNGGSAHIGLVTK